MYGIIMKIVYQKAKYKYSKYTYQIITSFERGEAPQLGFWYDIFRREYALTNQWSIRGNVIFYQINTYGDKWPRYT